MNNRRYIEELNYSRDPRTQGRIVAPVVHRWSEERGEYDEIALPWRYEVCPVCEGKGTHVNPSIDCGGLTRADFEEQGPEFEEMYFSGGFDVQCYTCGGLRVVPMLDEERCEPALLEEYEAEAREDAAYEAECRAERLMGA